MIRPPKGKPIEHIPRARGMKEGVKGVMVLKDLTRPPSRPFTRFRQLRSKVSLPA